MQTNYTDNQTVKLVEWIRFQGLTKMRLISRYSDIVLLVCETAIPILALLNNADNNSNSLPCDFIADSKASEKIRTRATTLQITVGVHAMRCMKWLSGRELCEIFTKSEYEQQRWLDSKLMARQGELMIQMIAKANSLLEEIKEIRKTEQKATTEGGLSEKLKQKQEELDEQRQLIDALDISFSSMAEELLLASESSSLPHDKESQERISAFQRAFERHILEGMELKLLQGNPLFIASNGLASILQSVTASLEKKLKKLSVVSIIGNQKTYKSTLLNYLCGSNFPSSEGKCTEGISCYLTSFGDGHYVLFLDTEGSSSLESERSEIFDKQLTIPRLPLLFPS